MKFLFLFLIPFSLHAAQFPAYDPCWVQGSTVTASNIYWMAESSTTTAANTNEQTLIEIINAPLNLLLQSVNVDMTNASTFTAMQFRLYRKRGAGSYVQQGNPVTPGLTGVIFTLIGSVKGFDILAGWPLAIQAGDSFKVTGQQTVLSASFAIPYSVVAIR